MDYGILSDNSFKLSDGSELTLLAGTRRDYPELPLLAGASLSMVSVFISNFGAKFQNFEFRAKMFFSLRTN